MDIRTLAGILLGFHIVSGIFMGLVIRKQWGLFAHDIEGKYRSLRKLLFILSLVIFAGNLIPIIVDGGTVIGQVVGRNPHPKAISVAYAVSNACVALISSILIWVLYKLAEIADRAK